MLFDCLQIVRMVELRCDEIVESSYIIYFYYYNENLSTILE